MIGGYYTGNRANVSRPIPRYGTFYTELFIYHNYNTANEVISALYGCMYQLSSTLTSFYIGNWYTIWTADNTPIRNPTGYGLFYYEFHPNNYPEFSYGAISARLALW